jgi:tetratricopeptide (TPR) repeat protein
MESPNANEQTQPVRPGNLEDTQPPVDKTQGTKTQPADQVDTLFKTEPVMNQPNSVEPEPVKVKTRRLRRFLIISGGILFVLLSAFASGYLGYHDAIRQRIERQANRVLAQTADQYNRALGDIADKQWDRARTRLEYVIELNPSFPGAADKLKEVLVAQIRIATPTQAPTATETSIPGTATPDLRSAQDYFNQVQQLIDAKNWNQAITTIEQLRQENKAFHTVEVDGMLYLALRNRGVDKILQKGQLEQGSYDLALAEAISPLDAQAYSYRTWAAAYLSGASYWGVNWQRVVDAFGQLYPSLPMLRDGNGWTAQERFRVASIKLADEMAAAGQFCKAQEHYDAALTLSKDASVQATAQANQIKCADSQKAVVTETPIPTLSLTPTVTLAETTAVPTNPPAGPTATGQPPSPTNTQLPAAPTATPAPPQPTSTPAPTAG